MKPLIVFDLDNTLYRGDDPFRYYAAAVSRKMAPKDARAYREAVESHLSGVAGIVEGDNWEAVVVLARKYLRDDPVLIEAFHDVRDYILSPQCLLEVPPGLRDFLHGWQEWAAFVCVSNSPQNSAVPVLEKLGLLWAFEKVFAHARKPEGLAAITATLLEGNESGGDVLSVGDHYLNDIAPALKKGWATAHISPRGYFPGPSTYQGRTMEDVLPGIQHWLAARLEQTDYGQSTPAGMPRPMR